MRCGCGRVHSKLDEAARAQPDPAAANAAAVASRSNARRAVIGGGTVSAASMHVGTKASMFVALRREVHYLALARGVFSIIIILYVFLT